MNYRELQEHPSFQEAINVDFIPVTPESLFEFLSQARYIGHGTRAIVFEIDTVRDILASNQLNVETTRVRGNVIRVPFYSGLGKDRMVTLLSKHQRATRIHHLPLPQVINELISTDPRQYKAKTVLTNRELLVRVAAANKNFSQHPRKTIPINTIISVKEHLVATIEKRVQGRHPQFESEYYSLRDEFEQLKGDFAPGNVFLDVSPVVDEDGTVRFLHPFHIIDFDRFEP